MLAAVLGVYLWCVLRERPDEVARSVTFATIVVGNLALILVNRLKVEGFIVSEHMEVWPEALTELGTLVGQGKLRPRETVAQGLENAPEASMGLLRGKNFGKQLVKLI